MKLNLGCGSDHRPGYTNVDFVKPCDVQVDLEQFPWPWDDSSVDEIIMLDFLEHFPYSRTETILSECWRILVPGGKLDVQVPDLEPCARAAMSLPPFLCHGCGYEFQKPNHPCLRCGRALSEIRDAAIHRLYGGQDRPGNWHYNAFTTKTLEAILSKSGFGEVTFLDRNENGETYYQNWNMKATARKIDAWED